MLIKYINTKEDYCDVLEYFGIKKLKVLNFIAFCLSIVVAICIYVLLYKFDNIYRVIISLLISILICVFAIKRNRESFYDVANKLVSNEMLELTINKNKNYNLLNINNKWVLIDGNKRYKLQINRLKGYYSSFWDFLIDQFNYLNLFSNISECIQTFV